MPDNVTAPAAGAAFATDEIGGVHWPFAKMAFGQRETAHEVEDAAGKRLPVLAYLASGSVIALDAATLAALENIGVTLAGPLPAGANNIGIVDLSAAALAALESIQATVAGTVALDAATLAALENITATVGSPVTLSPIDRPIAEPTFAGARVPVAASSAVNSLPTLTASRRIRVLASTRCFLRTGAAGVTAGTDGNSLAIAADAEVSFIVPAGHSHFAVVRDSADGFISLMPWAN